MTQVLTTNTITDRQRDFITSLLKERSISEQTRTDMNDMLRETPGRSWASETIDYLLKQPKLAPGKSAAAPSSPVQEALALIPKSKYAIPAEEIDAVLEKTPVTGDLLFIEVREYMNRLYMRRLTGAPGGFSRWQVAQADAVTIAKLIKTEPYKYTKLFGEHYSCCGSCGAELTDQRSRELQLGPECRKKFGFAK